MKKHELLSLTLQGLEQGVDLVGELSDRGTSPDSQQLRKRRRDEVDTHLGAPIGTS